MYAVRTIKGLVFTSKEQCLNLRIRADVEKSVDVLAAYQLFSPGGKDFWVVALSDEDNGPNVCLWYDGEWTGVPIYEAVNCHGCAERLEVQKLVAEAFAYGYAHGYSREM